MEGSLEPYVRAVFHQVYILGHLDNISLEEEVFLLQNRCGLGATEGFRAGQPAGYDRENSGEGGGGGASESSEVQAGTGHSEGSAEGRGRERLRVWGHRRRTARLGH